MKKIKMSPWILNDLKNKKKKRKLEENVWNFVKKNNPFSTFPFKINVIDQFHYLTGISKFSDLIRASNRVIRTSEHEINSKLD